MRNRLPAIVTLLLAVVAFSCGVIIEAPGLPFFPGKLIAFFVLGLEIGDSLRRYGCRII